MQTRPIIVRSLLIEATPYHYFCVSILFPTNKSAIFVGRLHPKNTLRVFHLRVYAFSKMYFDYFSVLQSAAMRCSALQCTVVCCSMLQCIAVCSCRFLPHITRVRAMSQRESFTKICYFWLKIGFKLLVLWASLSKEHVSIFPTLRMF